jgi:hypothetical protein
MQQIAFITKSHLNREYWTKFINNKILMFSHDLMMLFGIIQCFCFVFKQDLMEAARLDGKGAAKERPYVMDYLIRDCLHMGDETEGEKQIGLLMVEGLHLELGVGCQRNVSDAFGRYLNAAESGVTSAKVKVVMMYKTGNGIEWSMEKSL